jgi:cupin 2 domain-containing protein
VAVRNLFDGIGGALPRERFDELLRTQGFRIERIVSRGQVSPPGFWYDQETDEWVLLLSGAATLCFADGSSFDLKSGDYLFIPRRCRHRVTWTDPERDTVWLAVHGRTAQGDQG